MIEFPRLWYHRKGYISHFFLLYQRDETVYFTSIILVKERHLLYQKIDMRVIAVRALLIIIPFVLTVSRCSVIRRRLDSRVGTVNAGSSSKSNNMHNVTVDCGNPMALRMTGLQCQRDMDILTSYGFPWSPQGSQKKLQYNLNVADRNKTLRDSLDSLNEVCQAYDRSMRCLEESGIQGYCVSLSGHFTLTLDFQYICHHQPRDENLIHSFQCLYNTRVLAMLYFHIADRCGGTGILDNIMRRHKNAYFYGLDVNPVKDQNNIPRLYCLPKSLTSSCIRGIIEEDCGLFSADLVQNYILHLQDFYAQSLESEGLNSKVCDRDIRSEMVPKMSPVPSGFTRLGISRLLEIIAPGTALDTLCGKDVLAAVHNFSGIELCSMYEVSVAYEACIMSSDDSSEKSKFNILQFAHQVFPNQIYHGTQCSRLEEFTACWNLLQEICGPKVLGMKQHATLLVEGCKIQSEMDAVGCHWQDMLLEGYIQASRVTRWPTVNHCLQNPFSLEDSHYDSFDGFMNDMDTVISLLQPGVDEIFRKCGAQHAQRIRELLKKLRRLQRDANKYKNSFLQGFYPDK